MQIKDYFFHNANSMFRRDVWEKYKFSEKVTNIEDRVWGKEVTEDGLSIIYEPEASVYHHHGLHQGNNKNIVLITTRRGGGTYLSEFIRSSEKSMRIYHHIFSWYQNDFYTKITK